MSKFKIFIDAGHNDSRWDTGAEGNGLREQDITFTVAKLIEAKIPKDTCEVKLSRNNKTDILGTNMNSSLSKRAELANNWGADLFVSIHCNSHANPDAKGTEVWSYYGENDNDMLAEEICNALCKTLGMVNRGEKDSGFAVISRTNMPAILIEMGFISNPDDAFILKNKQDVIASTIVDAILEHYDIKSASKKELTSANDIIWQLMNGSLKVEINDVSRAVQHLEKAQTENSSLYWILRKIANK